MHFFRLNQQGIPSALFMENYSIWHLADIIKSAVEGAEDDIQNVSIL